MKIKKTLLIISFLLMYAIGFCQQIGNGYAPNAIPTFNTDLLSGFYQGYNATGQVQASWAHLLNLRHSNVTNTYQLQITSSYSEDDKLYFRKFARGTLGINNPTWFEIATRGVNTFVGNQTINGILNVTGDNALNFSTYGGGFYMSDTSWIRTSGNKNFYHNTGVMRTDGTFQVGPNGDRFVVHTNGLVGVGTATPTEKLEVAGTGLFKVRLTSSVSNNEGGHLSLNNPSKTAPGLGSSWKIYNMTGGYGNSLQFYVYDNLGCVTGGLCAPRMTLLDTGNVGVGITTPTEKLQVSGSVLATSFKKQEGTSSQFLMADGSTTTITNANTLYTSDGILSGPRTITMGANPITFSGTGNYIINAGNVGIGIINPTEKLAVNGNIHAKEVRVDLTGWPDYVFQKYYTGKSKLKADYKLPTLAEIEDFTKKNNHLPNVPSAATIKEKGLQLGEMSNVLLQKIEELTIYAIEQDKKNIEQQKEIESLKKENEQYKLLVERVVALEKK